MHSTTIEELRKVIAFSNLPDEHLQWILERSEYQELEDGALLIKFGEPVDVMWILLEGKVSFYMNINGRQVYYYTFDNDIPTGGVGGLMPYSRMKTSPGYSYAMGKTRVLRLDKKYFSELEQLNPELIQKLIGYMTERAKSFATTQLQQEKVSALGKLSAGIAHELNNPASAINRISSTLTKNLQLNYELTEKLLHHCISAEHIRQISNMVQTKEAELKQKAKRSALQQIEIEDEIVDWLEQNGFKEFKQAGETFTQAGFLIEDFEKIRISIGNDAFINVLQWLENLISSQRIIKDLEDASGRISTLVGAIKSHVHMDQTNDVQCTNINNDIENTLTLLGYKLREKNITVKKKFSESLPPVEAYIGELNQVWTNIIDNAIFALDKNGELIIETTCDNKNVSVCITDNGSGIPPEILSRIFDPFFTTKKVGQGTGIGLDLVNRTVKRHNGVVKVYSVPGKTTFDVCIPVKQKTEEK